MSSLTEKCGAEGAPITGTYCQNLSLADSAFPCCPCDNSDIEDHRIIEYLELEVTHKDHRVQLPR